MKYAISLIVLAVRYALPFARVLLSAANDGYVDRGEAVAMLYAAWPNDKNGEPVRVKIPFCK